MDIVQSKTVSSQTAPRALNALSSPTQSLTVWLAVVRAPIAVTDIVAFPMSQQVSIVGKTMGKRLIAALFLFTLGTACQATPTVSTQTVPSATCQHDVQCVHPWHPSAQQCTTQRRCVNGQCIQPAAETGIPDSTTGTLHFESNRGQQTLNVEIADDNFERARGMMCRTSMKRDWGMLFLMPNVQIQRFWMKNTLVPLDMIFIDEHWTIVGIVDNVPQQTLQTNQIDRPSLYVLELEAGESERLGLFAGQALRFVAPAP